MNPAPALEVVATRLRGLLAFLRPRLMLGTAELDRLSMLRRTSDVRVRQHLVGRPRITVPDVCGFLADPAAGRFDALAVSAGLLHRAQLGAALAPLGGEMGMLVEACLTHQVLGTDRMKEEIAAFVTREGPPPPPLPSELRAASRDRGDAPLPPPVRRILGAARGLWTMPDPVAKIVLLFGPPETPVGALAPRIEADPGLSAMCLRVANSATWGRGAAIGSVREALLTLSVPVVRSFFILAAISARFGRRHKELDIDLKDYWGHSLRVARAAALFARAMRLPRPEEFFAAGFAHDFGKLVVYQYLHKSLKGIREKASKGTPYVEAEQAALGTGHAEIGACLCERWHLSPAVVEAARHHHDPCTGMEDSPLPRQAMVVAALCHLDRGVADSLEERAWCGLLGAPPARVKEIRLQADGIAKECLMELFRLS